MDQPQDIHVLLLAGDAVPACRRAEALKPAATTVWLALAEVPAGTRCDLVVVEGDLPLELPPAAAEGNPPPDAATLPPGVIRLGGSQEADVCLPPDATPRELQLAVRLLGEVVRLRRQLQAVSHVQQRLSREVLTDPLTGLPNRRAWDEMLTARLAAAAARSDCLCLAIIDLDRFKGVNDRLGHAAGDAVLRETADRLRHSLRQDDFVARLGGDEFGLLLWVPDTAVARIVVDRVRRGAGVKEGGPDCNAITASAGFSVAPPSAPPGSDALLTVADEALRAAKSQGRNRTVCSREFIDP